MRKKRKKDKFKKSGIVVFSLLLIVCGSVGVVKGVSEKRAEKSEPVVKKEEEKREEVKKEPAKKEVVISVAGDCTLGTDTNFNQSSSFNAEVRNSGNDYASIMKNVYDIFSKDDYTLVNLETTFTDATSKINKGQGVSYHFKGDKEYTNILKEGAIEGVSIANNHINDYGEKGFKDTVKALEETEIDIAGEGYKILKEIKGIKFAFLGYQAWSDTEEIRNKITADIEEMKDSGALVVIPYFHWGIERDNKPYDVQINLAKHAIDSGASMVLGAHPHVIQSIEEYKGKLIAYSLGNFSFGGNSNPSDKRAIIVQMKFKFEDENLENIEFKVIPTSISSVSGRNDYRPTPYEGQKKNQVLEFVNSLSNTLNGKIKDEFFEIK